MQIATLDCSKKVVITAEIGNNHEGSFDVASRMLDAAVRSGADVVKFQTIRADAFVSPKNTQRYATLKRFELTDQQYRDLADMAKDRGVLFMSTPFDLDAVDLLASLVPAFKIASGDNNFYPLIKKIVATKKPIILSTGMLSLASLGNVVEFILNEQKKVGVSRGLALLHCVVAYPTPQAEANLGAIRELSSKFSLPIGYSDHVIGIEPAVLAVAAGARIIEKHFTLDNNFSAHRDHQLSLNPEDFREMVRRIRIAEELLGSGVKEPQESEKANIVAARRSIVAARELEAGRKLALSDLTWMRPGSGIPPGEEQRVVGRTLSTKVDRGDPITEDLLKA